jgi:hypothetical protein
VIVSANSAEQEQEIHSKLEATVQHADEWYRYLKQRHDDRTKIETVVVMAVAALAVLIAAGFSATGELYSTPVNPVYFLLGLIVIPTAAGLVTWAIRKRRRFPFAELGSLVAKMKGGQASAEDGLRMIDAMHDALLAMKKGKMDSAFTNGGVAFILVALFGANVAVGLLTGAIVYLYFRYEAMKEYESESRNYEEAKRDFVQNLWGKS